LDSVKISKVSDDFKMKTVSDLASKSRDVSNGLLSLLAPFATADTLPKLRVNNVTIRLVSLHATERMTIASDFSVDIYRSFFCQN
jgi:hypothetical protein